MNIKCIFGFHDWSKDYEKCAKCGKMRMIDKDGNTYNTVKIGEQEWMAENLNVNHYRNGDPIPQVQDKEEWINLTTGAWCYYENNAENGKTYGKLYNWHAVNDPRGLTPEGCHVPTDAEWTTLTDYLGGESVAGGKLKETGTTHWRSPNTGATNENSFTALPGGIRGKDGTFVFIMEQPSIGRLGYWWSSTESDTSNVWARYMFYGHSDVERGGGGKVGIGFSVRCIRN